MKLKKKFMLNYEDEDWVCLSDFNKIKNKLKKTQKEKAKLESCIQSFYRKPMDYDIACRIVTKLLNEKNILKTENKQLKERVEAISEMETITQIKDWSDFVVAVGANISSTCIYAPREEGIYGEPSISFDNDGTVWAGGAHGSVCLFRKCPPALMYEMYMQRFNEVGK
ncbi:MAG: hypothetical protein E7017_01675 [Alphaproteobacteria bacterium]|nr:hypothetical protein [Alphaproteobacteria bacterium]